MEHEYRPVTGPELREARLALGAQVKEVAAQLGVNTATVWRWEHPSRTHGELVARKYLDALDRISKGVPA